MTTTGWNLLVYAIGGNDHELERVTHAVQDMHGALTSNQCDVAVQLHARSKTTRHWIAAGTKVHNEVLPIIADASEPSTLTDFLNASERAHPGRSTALVLWAHSTGLDHVHDLPPKSAAAHPDIVGVFGARRGPVLGGGPDLDRSPGAPALDPRWPFGVGRICPEPRGRPERYGCRWGPDPNTGDFLTNVGMKKAITTSARQRVDILGLNACGMASLEVVYELRAVADVLIACQVEALPWPYGAIIAALSANPTSTAEQLAHAFVDGVRDEIQAGARHDAISALWAGTAITQLATAFDAYARRINAILDHDWEAVSKAVMVEAQRVDDPYLVDLMSLIHVLGKHDDAARVAAGDVAARFRTMRLAHAASTTHPRVQGLSIFCPKTTHVDLTDAYKGIQFRINSWREVLIRFQRKLAAKA